MNGAARQDWTTRRLSDVAEFRSGDLISVAGLSNESSANPVPVYGGNGIAGYTASALITEPTVILGRVGQRCGVVYQNVGPAWITDNALYARRFKQSVDVQFLALCLEVARLNDIKNRNDLPLITQEILRNVEIAIPQSVDEQRHIASVINNANAMISALERMIAKKQAIKQGMMQKLLTGYTRLPGFTALWHEAFLREVAIIDPATLKASMDPRVSIDYISLEDIERGQILGHTKVRFGLAPSRARRVIKDGDILFGTVRPNLQSHAIYRGGLRRPIASTGFAVVRAIDERSDAQFLFYMLMSNVAMVQVDRIIAGSNYPAVSGGDVRRLIFNLPPFEEQRAIGLVLADCDDQISTLKRRLSKANDVKQGMMQQLLTGRVRLTGEDAP